MRVKICGITTGADAELAVRLGADAVGLNFYRPSPRFVEPERAREIVEVLPPFVEPVGVLVHPDRDWLGTCTNSAGIGVIQVYEGSVLDLAETAKLNGARVILAHGTGDAEDLRHLADGVSEWRAAGCAPAAVLVDARMAGLHGGTGQTPPWELVAGFDPGLPVILAGGLTPENVAEAIRIVRPYAVDVASGVEASPGRKDPEKLRRFLDHAREAAAKCGC